MPKPGAAAQQSTRDIMRIAPAFLALAALGFLTACNSEATCTAEEATKKSTDLTAKITEVATADPAKAAELMPKLQEMGTKIAAGGDDLAAACKAMDEMMAELSK
jgi:G:T/U-mismatch repair DNA glycosylase